MWLDAFKPKSTDMQKTGVSGVPGVPAPRQPNEYVGFAGTPDRNTAKNQGVPGVPGWMSGTPGTPRNTTTKTRFSSDAPPRQPNEYASFSVSGTPGTPGTPQKHDKPENNADMSEALAQFRFDLAQQEIEAGYPVDELKRVNNIAWRLITARGYPFQEAITAAAQWVAGNPQHQDETAFINVMAIFKGIQQ